eukprot:scaffold92760_cov43-Cyclotella_meneghiniana.AAC.2
MMSMIRQSHFTMLTARRMWHHDAVEEKKMLSYKIRHVATRNITTQRHGAHLRNSTVYPSLELA